jgi:hypothetical protein
LIKKYSLFLLLMVSFCLFNSLEDVFKFDGIGGHVVPLYSMIIEAVAYSNALAFFGEELGMLAIFSQV